MTKFIHKTFYLFSTMAFTALGLSACADHPRRSSESFHDQAISQKACPMCDLRYENLSQSDLSGGNFSGTYLFGANLAWSVLDAANFDSATMNFARMEWSSLEKANLRNACLTLASKSHIIIALLNYPIYYSI